MPQRLRCGVTLNAHTNWVETLQHDDEYMYSGSQVGLGLGLGLALGLALVSFFCWGRGRWCTQGFFDGSCGNFVATGGR